MEFYCHFYCLIIKWPAMREGATSPPVRCDAMAIPTLLDNSSMDATFRQKRSAEKAAVYSAPNRNIKPASKRFSSCICYAINQIYDPIKSEVTLISTNRYRR